MNTYDSLADAENLDALLAISRKTPLKNPQALVQAIETVLDTWHVDFHCGKFSNVVGSGYLEGIEAIEHILSQRQYTARVEFYLMAGQDCIQHNRTQALYYAELAHDEILASGDVQFNDQRFSLLLIDSLVLKRQILGDIIGATLFQQILVLCEHTALHYPHSSIWHNWLSYLIRPALYQEGWQRFCEFARLLHAQGQVEPFHIAQTLLYWQRHDTLPPGAHDEIRYWMEQARVTPSTLRSSEYFLHNYGHAYKQAGELLNEPWMLQQAVDTFAFGARHHPQSWCDAVYQCQAKQALSHLPAYHHRARLTMYAEIFSLYTQAIKRMSTDFTLHSHACDFIADYIHLTNNPLRQRVLNHKRLHWAYTAERNGNGMYWSPYQHLILGYAMFDDVDNLEAWILRSFMQFGISVEADLRNIAAELQSIAQNTIVMKHEPVANLLLQIQDHYNHLQCKVVDSRPDANKLRQMSLAELRAEFPVYCAAQQEAMRKYSTIGL